MRLVLKHFRKQSLLLTGLAGVLVSCGGSSDPLQVRQFHLRDTDITNKDAQMVRAEQLYRMNGAVTLEQRKNRLGNYYTIYWDTPEAAAGGMKIIFEYQQAATSSKVLTMTRNIPAGQSTGSMELNIIGKAYREGGSVLAWRARLMKGNQVIDSKRSYLWRSSGR